MAEDQRIHTLFNAALDDRYGARRWSPHPAKLIRDLGDRMVRAYKLMDKITSDTNVANDRQNEEDSQHDAR